MNTSADVVDVPVYEWLRTTGAAQCAALIAPYGLSLDHTITASKQVPVVAPRRSATAAARFPRHKARSISRVRDVALPATVHGAAGVLHSYRPTRRARPPGPAWYEG